MCWFCAQRDKSPTGCLAFPLGIPDEILDGSVDHRKPRPDDGGIQFEEKPNLDETGKKLLNLALQQFGG